MYTRCWSRKVTGATDPEETFADTLYASSFLRLFHFFISPPFSSAFAQACYERRVLRARAKMRSVRCAMLKRYARWQQRRQQCAQRARAVMRSVRGEACAPEYYAMLMMRVRKMMCVHTDVFHTAHSSAEIIVV